MRIVNTSNKVTKMKMDRALPRYRNIRSHNDPDWLGCLVALIFIFIGVGLFALLMGVFFGVIVAAFKAIVGI